MGLAFEEHTYHDQDYTLAVFLMPLAKRFAGQSVDHPDGDRHSPAQAWFDKTWRPGDIELLK
jgi:hypothetical protein